MNAANSLILILLVLAFMFCQPNPPPTPIIEDTPPATVDMQPETPIQSENSARA